MRTSLLALAIVLMACGRSEHPARPATSDAPSSSSTTGPDQIVLRVPQAGGAVRAYAFPKVDSLIWTSGEKIPSAARILGFDDAAGSLALEDAKGAVRRVDLRLGGVSRDDSPKLTGLASSDGSAVYGIGANGSVTRLTPTGSWTLKPPAPARDVMPQPDGSLLVLANRGDRTVVWLLHPPDSTLVDTATLPKVVRAFGTQLGDRVFFTVDSGLVGLRTRDLSRLPPIPAGAHVRAATTTPSGDRLYVALDSTPELLIVDRYSRKIGARVTLPAPAAALRMDAVGRYVLARAAHGDSAYVVAVGTDHVIGTVRTAWRGDLPAVAPNGWVALVRGSDVVFVDGETLHERRSVAGGAKDLWALESWNGFRPRAAGLDQPVTFGDDTAAARDTSGNASAAATDSAHATHDSARAAPPAPAHTGQRDTVAAAPARAQGFTAQFAAVRSEPVAKETASGIRVDGATPRVVATTRDGVTIYRVVIGPFPTRAEADRIARTSGKSYWVYEGAP